jgi:hypothetical protein
VVFLSTSLGLSSKAMNILLIVAGILGFWIYFTFFEALREGQTRANGRRESAWFAIPATPSISPRRPPETCSGHRPFSPHDAGRHSPRRYPSEGTPAGGPGGRHHRGAGPAHRGLDSGVRGARRGGCRAARTGRRRVPHPAGVHRARAFAHSGVADRFSDRWPAVSSSAFISRRARRSCW